MKTLTDYGISCPSNVGEHYCLCPECSSKRKKRNVQCLSVKVEADGSAVWYCHHCAWTGSLRNGTFSRSDPNAWKENDEWSRPKLSGAGRWRDGQLQHFYARKITQAVLDRNRVTVERVWIPQVEEFEDAVAFPFFRSGELVNVKYRGKNKNFRMARNAERIFYGLDDLTYLIDRTEGTPELVPQDIAYIVEGEMDKLAMDVAGYPNTISTPNGAPSPNTKNLTSYFEFIEASNYKLYPKDEEGLLDRIGTIYIAVDSDEPGQKLEEELVRRLGPDRCVRVRWPRLPLDREAVTLWDRKTVVQPGDRLKDANEVLFCLGAEGIQQAIREARPVPIDGIYTIEDYEEELDEYYRNGLPPGIPVGTDAFKDADGMHRLQLQTKTTWVVTGIPGHGKSRWVENIITHLIVNEGWAVAHFSPEVRPLPLQASYFLSQATGIPFEKGDRSRMTPEQYEKAKDLLRGKLFSYEAGLLPFSIDDLLDRATKLVKKFGVRALVIDPWNNLYHSRKAYEREDEYIGQALQKINAWRAKYDAWACIVAHPTKLKALNGVEPVADLNDIKGGSEFYAMADFGFSVWRDKANENLASQVHIKKSKFHHLATLGIAQLNFDKPTMRYSSAGIPFGAVQSKKIARQNEPASSMSYPTEDGAPPWIQGREWSLQDEGG